MWKQIHIIIHRYPQPEILRVVASNVFPKQEAKRQSQLPTDQI